MNVHANIPTSSRIALNDPTLLCNKAYVGGEWVDAKNEASFGVFNPFNGERIADVPDLDERDTRHAIDVAETVQKEWSKRTAKERAAVLRRWQELILANADDLALILTTEQGKPLAQAKGEVVANAAYFEWFAEEAKRIEGDIIPSMSGSQRILVLKQPVGVCAAITPWNFPNGMITRKVGPALAAGCTIILKPAELTPLSALALAVLGERAGVPKGAFSVITASNAPAIGKELCHNPKVAKISFTGSTEVGRWLMREGSTTIKRFSLELGGNAPFIVFEDADIDAAVDGAILSKFRNSGQTCVCANRIYVHQNIVEAFAEKLAAKVSKMTLGSGTDPQVDMGPLIDENAIIKVEEHLADALAKGAKLVMGGKRSKLGGTFYEPTILKDVSPDTKIASEETFGPLAPITAFNDEAEVIALANNSDYGLAGYFYSKDLARVWRVAEALECGVVGVNTGAISNEMTPFGGMKQSGLGREGSRYGIEGYVELKYVLMGGLN